MLLVSTLQHSRPYSGSVPGHIQGLFPATFRVCSRPHSRCVPGHIQGLFPATFKVCAGPHSRCVSHHITALLPEVHRGEMLDSWQATIQRRSHTAAQSLLWHSVMPVPIHRALNSVIPNYTTPPSDDTGQRWLGFGARLSERLPLERSGHTHASQHLLTLLDSDAEGFGQNDPNWGWSTGTEREEWAAEAEMVFSAPWGKGTRAADATEAWSAQRCLTVASVFGVCRRRRRSRKGGRLTPTLSCCSRSCTPWTRKPYVCGKTTTHSCRSVAARGSVKLPSYVNYVFSEGDAFSFCMISVSCMSQCWKKW